MCSALLSSKHSRLFIPGIILMIVLFSLVIVVFRCTSHWTSRTRVLAYTGLILPFMVIVRCVLESCSSFKTSYEFQAFRILNRNTPDSEDTADAAKQINPPNCHDTVLPTASTYILSQSSSVIGYKQDNSNVTWLFHFLQIFVSLKYNYKSIYLQIILKCFFRTFLFDFCCLNYNLCCLIHFILNYFSFSNNLTIQRSFNCW